MSTDPHSPSALHNPYQSKIDNVLISLNLIAPTTPSQFNMRSFWAALAFIVRFSVHRAYVDDQNADQVMLLVRSVGAFINREVDDLLRLFGDGMQRIVTTASSCNGVDS